ncbi:hypothetical protein [Desulfovibrio litoralis]|uniref:Uncharacterized protein n=1 Tax=Desulfovibrio litoralis DSM 11393 TaxID=1121455 RepID=A0A1M7T6M0_9BACT|nr:hypothetical protein [Desulfovibrio litoralis]SHN66358.1 hypothetical protein SAMN02745728_01625 [Desulfovibrio litoralis DSM 11393]
MSKSVFFYDAQDYELLQMVQQVLAQKKQKKFFDNDINRIKKTPKLLESGLHPHGIKELALSREIRIANSVIQLLYSLEQGKIKDRLTALKELHDEVLYSDSTNFRYNTGRVLIQIMKDLVRSFDDISDQDQNIYSEKLLRLANNFRKAVSGRRREIRALLSYYHLVEMPETWDQITFDHHVHDSNSKGRKTPTHLIMDAWIKGIRTLTVIYYNYIEVAAAQELLRAAKIININVRIGIEYRAVFYKRYISLIWELGHISEERDLIEFLNNPPVRHIMQEGKAASRYYTDHTLMLLNRYNVQHKAEIEKCYGINLELISPQEFLEFIGGGQASLLHLSELIKQKILTAFSNKLPELRNKISHNSQEENRRLRKLCDEINRLSTNDIIQNWLCTQKNSDLPNPTLPKTGDDVPELLSLSPKKLAGWINNINGKTNIILNLCSLNDADVLELLYDCEGMITHLELFNLKEYKEADLPRLQAVSDLQQAINTGSAVAIKRLTRFILQTQGDCLDEKQNSRCQHFNSILRNIPKLQDYYRDAPLMTTMGTDSIGRGRENHGMGLVFPETLPKRSQKYIVNSIKKNTRSLLPIKAQVYFIFKYFPANILPFGVFLTSLLRKLPGFSFFAYRKIHEWKSKLETAHYVKDKGNIATLGGNPTLVENGIYFKEPELKKFETDFQYTNTFLANIIKVSVGFLAALFSFLYTQDWWVIAWLGAPMFFAITVFRNILQSVLGGGGIKRSPLLRWNDYVSWNRICDSLFYSGLSVPLLELVIRSYILQDNFNLTVSNNPILVFSIISAANGAYITAHNIYRGLPKEAIYGNIFRSVLAVPVAMLYNFIIYNFLVLIQFNEAVLVVNYGSAVISKAASDTIAGGVEGFADAVNNLRLRRWDYNAKLKELFKCMAKLELLFPDKEVFALLLKPKELMHSLGTEASGLEKIIIVNALDLMYFWMYQPRARTMLAKLVEEMTDEERTTFAGSQLVLIREKEISRLFVDGLVGKNFSKALSFYLGFYKEYLEDMEKLTGINLHLKTKLNII